MRIIGVAAVRIFVILRGASMILSCTTALPLIANERLIPFTDGINVLRLQLYPVAESVCHILFAMVPVMILSLRMEQHLFAGLIAGGVKG